MPITSKRYFYLIFKHVFIKNPHRFTFVWVNRFLGLLFNLQLEMTKAEWVIQISLRLLTAEKQILSEKIGLFRLLVCSNLKANRNFRFQSASLHIAILKVW